jgi:hypothetical protein
MGSSRFTSRLVLVGVSLLLARVPGARAEPNPGDPLPVTGKEHVELKSFDRIKRMRVGHMLLKDRLPGEVHYYTAKNETGAAILGPDLGKQVPWAGQFAFVIQRIL